MNIDRNVNNLHPHIRARAIALIAALDHHCWTDGDGREWRFDIFEGWRSPARQRTLMKRGSVTKAGPWLSAHQYGLAADFAARPAEPIRKGGSIDWQWRDSDPWHILHRQAAMQGLEAPIPWDKGHVQSPVWREIRKLLRG